MDIPKGTAKELASTRVGGEYEGYVVKENRVIDTTRWSTVYSLVVEHDGAFGASCFSRGATEMQDEHPFEYDPDPVPFSDVFPVTVQRVEYKTQKEIDKMQARAEEQRAAGA